MQIVVRGCAKLEKLTDCTEYHCQFGKYVKDLYRLYGENKVSYVAGNSCLKCKEIQIKVVKDVCGSRCPFSKTSENNRRN